MLEAIGVFVLWTLIGGSIGVTLVFAGFLLVELRDSLRDLKSSKRG